MAMHAIRQSCHWAARSSHTALACTSAHGTRRAFSRSSACSRGALPVFVEPSSPELASLLATINAKVLLPRLLTKEQQKLVYLQDNKAKLEAEPVEITLGQVTLPLEHLDRNKLPNRWRQLREIVRQSETPADWENVVRLLEGFENAGIPLKPDRQELIVRRLNFSGMQHLVLKALQRSKATGLRLSNPGVLSQVLRGVHDKAVQADWERDETTKAFRLAKQVVELMDDEEHCGAQPRGEMASEHDWRSKPAVIALPTELAAVLAERHGGDVAEVKKLANRLLSAMKQHDYATELDAIAQRSASSSVDFKNAVSQLDAVCAHTLDLLQLAIVWNALKTSRKVLGADMPLANEAQLFETHAEKVLVGGLEAVERLLKRDSKQFVHTVVDHLRDTIERCR